jgi:Fic family protein
MVSIKSKKIGNQKYYYLYHDDKRGKRTQKEIYLGKKIPDDIEERKQELLLEINRDDWIPKLEKIKQNYVKQKAKLPPEIKEKELKLFSVKFTYNTQRIEGSTLTLKETHDLLEEGRSPSNKPNNDVKEAEAHQKLFFKAIKDPSDLSSSKVISWHKELLEETEPNIAGKLRDYNVGIGGSKFVPPDHKAVKTIVDGFFSWYNKNKNKLNPVELAALVHLKFVTIHPFGNGNGRISRLMMNFVLNKLGYPLLDIDYKDRRSYYNTLERAQTKEDDIIFLQWFMKRYLKIYNKFLT